MRIIPIIILTITPLVLCQEIPLQIQRSVKITFPSEAAKSYQLLASTNLNAENWSILEPAISGNGSNITIFYESEEDQKLFFKVQGVDGNPPAPSLFQLGRLDLSFRDLTGHQLPKVDLNYSQLELARFDSANLTDASFIRAKMTNTSFAKATASRANFQKVLAGQANFRDTKLDGADFSDANLQGADFSNADLTQARFQRADARAANFNSTLAANANFDRAQITGASFKLSKLNNATFLNVGTTMNVSHPTFYDVNFEGADLSDAVFNWSVTGHGTGLKFAGATLSNLQFINAWLYSPHFLNAELSGSVFRRVTIADANFSGAKFNGALFEWATISRADFAGANLDGLNLRYVTIIEAAFPKAQFGSKNFDFSMFRNVDWNDTDLSGSNFEFSTLQGGSLEGNNLRNSNLKSTEILAIDMRNTDLTGADLSHSKVIGADFTGALGLTTNAPGSRFINVVMPNGTTQTIINPRESFVRNQINNYRFTFLPAQGGPARSIQLNGGMSGAYIVNGEDRGDRYEYYGEDFIQYSKPNQAKLGITRSNGSTTWQVLAFHSSSSGIVYEGSQGGGILAGTFSNFGPQNP